MIRLFFPLFPHASVALAMLISLIAASLDAAHAETHALLVGVSGYPSLAESRRLRGPANDVQLMRAALVQHGVANGNITVLADGVPVSQALPTRQNILLAMRALAKRAKTGDWAVVYLSGHGSQQPQPPASLLPAGTYIEPDGLDEVFLPYDVGRWSGGKGIVEGALIDDEIGAELAQITQRGVRVWAVFDTCHAGDMAKGFEFSGSQSGGAVNRYVSPSTLGIPAQAMDAAQALAKKGPRRSRTNGMLSQIAPFAPSGELVVFYASQPEEPAAEEPLAVPALLGQTTEPKRYFGLFTYLIAKTLPDWHGDFAQLAAQIAKDYKTRPYPTPMFEGNLRIKPDLRQ